ncbi:MAG: AmmeMemoRadiSam system radical SAM enzyme [Patescibacteria group bacterium]|nr:AmmeMemoRadiSam system radical SAM enzyme [Patescibacteria group bacterium]
MQEANFYKPARNNAIRCSLCQHNCLILEKNYGICQTRKNIGNKLYSLVYGFPAALNVDSVEKKPLFHFLPGSFTYSLGTYGCNFKCANCQNWDISQNNNIEKEAQKLNFATPEKIIEDALGDNCKSISYTYNEPTIFCEYALDIMRLAHKYGLKNIWVSNGYMGKSCLEAIIPYLDAINIDLKSFDNNFYKKNCAAKLKPVLNNLIQLKKEQIHLEVTTLIIPGLSDDLKMLEELTQFIITELNDDTPWHISKFSAEASWRLKNLPSASDDIIYQAYEIGKDAGLKYVYVGNIPGDQKENTYCPKCGALIIRRLGYEIERFDENGGCPYCDRSLDIIN